MSLAGRGFNQTAGARPRGGVLQRRAAGGRVGQQRRERQPARVPRRWSGAGAGGRGIGLSVAAMKPDGSVASFSNHNPFVSLAAPGRERRAAATSASSRRSPPPRPRRGTRAAARASSRARAGRSYAYGEGTSFAAPIVSGLAALAWQAERRLASEQVADVLVRAADGERLERVHRLRRRRRDARRRDRAHLRRAEPARRGRARAAAATACA